MGKEKKLYIVISDPIVTLYWLTETDCPYIQHVPLHFVKASQIDILGQTV